MSHTSCQHSFAQAYEVNDLVRELTIQQGFMLAQIVVEIPARDSAAEGVTSLGRLRRRLCVRTRVHVYVLEY